MLTTRVLGMVPLIPHRDQGLYYSTKARNGGAVYMREDQQNQASPTVFHRPLTEPQDKLYVLQYEGVRRYGPNRGELCGEKRSYDNVRDVIKVPNGAV